MLCARRSRGRSSTIISSCLGHVLRLPRTPSSRLEPTPVVALDGEQFSEPAAALHGSDDEHCTSTLTLKVTSTALCTAGSGRAAATASGSCRSAAAIVSSRYRSACLTRDCVRMRSAPVFDLTPFSSASPLLLLGGGCFRALILVGEPRRGSGSRIFLGCLYVRSSIRFLSHEA